MAEKAKLKNKALKVQSKGYKWDGRVFDSKEAVQRASKFSDEDFAHYLKQGKIKKV